MFALVPLVVLVLGLLLYAYARQNLDLKEVARIMVFVGLFFTVWALSGERVRMLP